MNCYAVKLLRVWLFNRGPTHHANLCAKKAAAVSEPPLSLVINDLRSIGNIVVNPFGMVGRKPDASRGRTLSHSGVHHVKRPRIARLRVEQIVTVELRIIPAGISMPKRKPLSIDGILAQHGRRLIFARSALPERP